MILEVQQKETNSKEIIKIGVDSAMQKNEIKVKNKEGGGLIVKKVSGDDI